jgi:hypothetical protein
MNLNDIFNRRSSQRIAKERALDELCQKEAEKKFYEPEWKAIAKAGLKLAIPTAIAGLMGSHGGLEYMAANAGAVIVPNIVFGAGAFGVYKYLKNRGTWNLDTQKKVVVNCYKEIIEENFSFSIPKLSTVAIVQGLVSLGLATLAYKSHMIPDFSGNILLGTGLINGGITYCENYMKQSKMKKKVDDRAWEIIIEMEVEMRKEEEKRYEESRRDYEESFRNFQDAFRDFQNAYGADGSRSKDKYYYSTYEEKGSSHRRRPIRTSQISNSEAFATLGITRTVGYEAARSSFRKLAMKYHPDRNKGDKQAEARFKEVSQAWEIVEQYYRTS